MLTLGIDLSSQPKDTAACLIDWRDGRVAVRETSLHCDDATLDALIRTADAVGIDAPLGWPDAFTEAVGNWTATTWVGEVEFQKNLRLRRTDRFIQDHHKLTPLSVSTDRIALPAMRAMALLARHGVTDRSGADGKFFEVYPAGSLKQWGLHPRGYKGDDATAVARRHALLGRLRQALPTLIVADSCVETDHAFDALIASLTTRAAATRRTIGAPPEHIASSRREGWIHLPITWPD